MSNTRREFLQTSAALAVGLMGGAATELRGEPALAAQTPATTGSGSVAQVQVPRMKFGSVEISRLVLGSNQFHGFAHYNTNFGKAMTDWYTPDKICEVLHRANSYGINAFNYLNWAGAPEYLARFQAEGGKMHLIAQVTAHDDAASMVKNLKPLALQRQGEVVDVEFRNGTMDTVKEWCKQVRDMGVLVGVGTHKPEVIEYVEEKGWDVDFYSGCVYNRTRTEAEWKQLFHGEMLEMPHDIYLRSDPERMYKVMRQTTKPCFAFKILAAGRIDDPAVEEAFRTAYASIKPIDGVYVGMFPKRKDEVKENAEIVHRILTTA